MIFDLTGGGSSLNFKVVGNPQPTSPGENTIWLDTDTGITGWVFRETQPTGLVSGNVWIETGRYDNGKFNAVRHNGIMVFPVRAWQFIGGQLVSVPAKIYKSGQWHEWWTGAIFVGGVDYVGGFSVAENQGTVTIGDVIQISRSIDAGANDGGGYTKVTANEPIETGSYGQLQYTIDVISVDKENDNNHAQLQVGFVDSTGEWVASQTLNAASLTSGQHSVSIQLSGKYYLCISAYTYLHYGKISVRITDVRME